LRATTGFLYALTIGAVCGLGLTWFGLGGGPMLGAMRIGPWTAWPEAGTQDADRYVRASLARSGDLPLGAGEGLAFTAEADSFGDALDGRCRYRVDPVVPPARWWTLTLYDENGQLVANPASRFGFTSAEVLRRGDGTTVISIAPEVRPGNWLPSPKAPFSLVLRLYDTPIAAGFGRESEVSMPQVIREACP